VVDDEDLYGFFLGGELESQGLQCPEEAGGLFVVVCALKNAGGHVDGKIIAAFEACFVYDLALRDEVHQDVGELGHAVVEELRVHLAVAFSDDDVAAPVDVGFAGFEFGRSFFYGEGVDREDFLHDVELELEAVGEEFFEHRAVLVDAWLAFGIGFGGDVEAQLVEPVRGAFDLACSDFVGEFDEIGDGGVLRSEVAGAQRVGALRCSGRAGFNGGDFKGGIGGL